MLIWRQNKFGVAHRRDRTVGNRTYASGAEKRYREYLDMLAMTKLVSDIVEQPKVDLTAGITYKPDFRYTDTTGMHVWVEVKGVMTDRFRMIKKLWRVYGPGPLHVVREDRTKGRFGTIQIIYPKGGDAID